MQSQSATLNEPEPPPLTPAEEVRVWRDWCLYRPPGDPLRKLGERNLRRAGMLGGPGTQAGPITIPAEVPTARRTPGVDPDACDS